MACRFFQFLLHEPNKGLCKTRCCATFCPQGAANIDKKLKGIMQLEYHIVLSCSDRSECERKQLLSETLLKRKDTGRDRSTMRRQPLFMVFRMVKYLPAVSNLDIHPVASMTSSSWSSYKQNQSRVRCRPPCNLPCRPSRSEKDEQIKDEVDMTGSREKGSISEAGRNGRRGMWLFFF